MNITFLGQAGVHIALENGKSIVVDPYLSDALFQKKGTLFARLVPIDSYWQGKRPDVISVTHDHADHMDMPSLEQWLDDGECLQIVALYPVFRELSCRWPGRHNIMVMNPDVEVTLCGIHIRAIPAFHETPDAVGYLVCVEGKTI